VKDELEEEKEEDERWSCEGHRQFVKLLGVNPLVPPTLQSLSLTNVTQSTVTLFTVTH